MARTKQQEVSMLERNIKEAMRLGPTGRNLMYIFNDPGNFNEQTVPPVQAGQYLSPAVRVENIGRNLGYNPQEILNTILQQAHERRKREIRLNQMRSIQHLLQTSMGNQPLVSGQLGRMKFGAGPFIGSSGGRPNVGVGVRGGFSF